MELIKAENLARKLMNENNLYGWGFAFSRGRRALGLCRIKSSGLNLNKTIQLSKYMVLKLDDSEIKDTILHEIAHAIQWDKSGYLSHDNEWKEILISIGGSGERTADIDRNKIDYKYVGVCSKCGKEVGGWMRMPKRNFLHKNCGGVLKMKKLR
jgi:predicted SprT family Zn-dependent metalloprotease